jgi:hypothetical protein
MLYCDECGGDEWPQTREREVGACEICGKLRCCNSVAARLLPNPAVADPPMVVLEFAPKRIIRDERREPRERPTEGSRDGDDG